MFDLDVLSQIDWHAFAAQYFLLTVGSHYIKIFSSLAKVEWTSEKNLIYFSTHELRKIVYLKILVSQHTVDKEYWIIKNLHLKNIFTLKHFII